MLHPQNGISCGVLPVPVLIDDVVNLSAPRPILDQFQNIRRGENLVGTRPESEHRWRIRQDLNLQPSDPKSDQAFFQWLAEANLKH